MNEGCLIAATYCRAKTALRLLLENGADVNFRDLHGKTALMHACERCSVEMARILIDHGADLNAQCQLARKTALMYAVTRQTRPVLQLLLDRGADVNLRNVDGYTALTLAKTFRLHKQVAMLVTHGHRRRNKVGRNLTPAQYWNMLQCNMLFHICICFVLLAYISDL